MKKTKSLLLVIFMGMLLFVLTGCANINYEVKLNKDGSGEVSYLMGYDKKFLTSMGITTEALKEDDSFTQMEEEAKQEGYTVEKYEDENTYGFKAYKQVKNIQEEFSIENAIENNEGSQDDGINFEKSLFKTKFSQNAKLDLTDLSEGETDALTNALLAQMKISYKITLPFKVGENNATTVSEDGKTLEWTLTAGQTNEIHFEAAEDYTMYVAVGAIVVIVLIILAAIILASRKNKKEVVTIVKKDTNKKIETPKKEESKQEKKVEEKIETSKLEQKQEDKKEEEKKEIPAKENKEEKPEDNK